MLNTRSPELIHLIQFVPLDQHLSISSIRVSGNHSSTIYFSEFDRRPPPRPASFFLKVPYITENLSSSDLFHLGKKKNAFRVHPWLDCSFIFSAE